MALEVEEARAVTLGAPRPRWGAMVGAAAILLAFVAVTNRWRDWAASLTLVHANDEVDYRAIATAAPHFSSARLQNQHAERFAFHYLIGLLGRALGTNVDHVYAVATALVVIALVGVLMCVLASLELSSRAAVVCLAVFILNPYSIRYYLIARGEITDLLFDLGVLISLWGLLDRRYRLVLLGTIVAATARQTELPAAVMLGVAVLAWPPAGAWPRRLGRAALPVLLAVVIYLIEVHVARSFSYDDTPGLKSFTILGEIEALPHHAGTLADHVLRSVNGLLSVAALVLVGVVAELRRRRWRSLGVGEFWACLGVACAIAVQALVLSASYAEHNETRLSVLALGALVCALAVLFQQLERAGLRLGTGPVAALIAVLAVGSFHHLYTVLGTANAHQTVVLQVIVAIALAAILRSAVRSAAGQRSPAPAR